LGKTVGEEEVSSSRVGILKRSDVRVINNKLYFILFLFLFSLYLRLGFSVTSLSHVSYMSHGVVTVMVTQLYVIIEEQRRF